MNNKPPDQFSKGGCISALSIIFLLSILLSMCSKSNVSVGQQIAYDKCVDEKMKVLKLNIIDADGACYYWKRDRGSNVDK